MQPTQFYQWQKQLFESKRKANGPSIADRKIAALEAMLSTKNEVIAALMEENAKAKKEFGKATKVRRAVSR